MRLKVQAMLAGLVYLLAVSCNKATKPNWQCNQLSLAVLITAAFVHNLHVDNLVCDRRKLDFS